MKSTATIFHAFVFGVCAANTIISLVLRLPRYSSVCHFGVAMLLLSILLQRSYWPIYLATVCATASLTYALLSATSWSEHGYARIFVIVTAAPTLFGAFYRYRTVNLVLKRP